MKKARFNIFKTQLYSFFDTTKNEFPDTEEFIDIQKERLLSEFPEFRESLETTSKQNDKRKIYEKVETTLKTTFDSTRLMCYHGIEINGSNPEECIKTINTITQLVGNSHKEVLYYSAEQGRLLQTLKDISTPESYKYLCQRHINLSTQHINFLMRFHRLVEEFPKLYLCVLPLNFFNKNFKIIKEICEQSGNEWK